MHEKRFRTASIEELERADGWSPVRRALGVQAFGVNGWTAHQPGEQVIVEGLMNTVHASDIEEEIPTEEELDVLEPVHPHIKGHGPVE